MPTFPHIPRWEDSCNMGRSDCLQTYLLHVNFINPAPSFHLVAAQQLNAIWVAKHSRKHKKKYEAPETRCD